MADDQARFETLLRNLLSLDNDARSQGEETLEKIPGPSQITYLLQTLQNVTAGIDLRSLAAVLLRRVFTAKFDEAWPQVPPITQNAIKDQILDLVRNEPDSLVRKKICDVVAELARNLFDDDGNMTWPDILAFLFECASSQNAAHRESSLHILSAVPSVFGNQQTHYIEVIKTMLCRCLQDKEKAVVPAYVLSIAKKVCTVLHLNFLQLLAMITLDNSQFATEVWTEAVKATSAFLIVNTKEQTVLNHHRELLPLLMQGVIKSVQEGNEDSLLKCLIDLAENMPKYLRSQLDIILPFCLKVVANTKLDQDRHLALEVIVTLSETAPAMVRKYGKYIPTLVMHTLKMMVDLEEDPTWSEQDEVEDDDNESNAIVGENALDRLACALGGKTILPHVAANLPQLMTSTDWRHRYAALMAISVCGEGCHTQMEEMLANIVDMVLQFLKDQHPRVRYAACNALGQMATDFGPNFQKKFHQKVVVNLLMMLDDDDNPRVQAHSAAALVNFSDECPQNILLQYLDAILTKFEQVLNKKFMELAEKGRKMVLEQLVTTLAAVADTAEEQFVSYYDKFMPCLKYIVQNATSSELRLLRGKTIECISLIGLAVGKEKFMSDCSDVMQLLLKTQTSLEDLPDDDPQISYMISAWARMCKILGKEFQQYLPLVMKPVLKAVAIQPEVALVNSQDMKEMEDDDDWQFITVGGQQGFGIRTAGLEEKATACQMLVCYARELKEGFAEYIEEVVKLVVPLLKFLFNDDVRIAASECMPYLLDCAKIRGEQYVADMWNFICPDLLKAIEFEPEKFVLPEHLSSMAMCIEKLGKGCLTDAHMTQLVNILNKLLTEHFHRQMERQEKRKDEDYDEDVEEELQEQDEEDVYVLSKISDIMHSLFGANKKDFLPVFDHLSCPFVKLVNPEQPWSDRQWGMCVWDDVIEYTGVESAKYRDCFVPQMINCICDKMPQVRQTALYGIGIMAEFAEPVFHSVCVEALPLVIKVIQHPQSRNVENLSATENAISAVTKICRFCSSHVNVSEILPHWLSWLPVWEDEDEAEHIYSYLCELLQMNHPAVLGENNQNLPKVVAIFAEAIQREAMKPETQVYTRVLDILRQIQTNTDVFQACIGQLSESHKSALSAALFGH